MDLSNLNSRVVFKEPRGMVRWLQLIFAILAVTTVVNFLTTVQIDITCPTSPTPSTSPAPLPTSSSSTPSSSSSSSSAAPQESSSVSHDLTAQINHAKLVITYPFDFTLQKPVQNECTGNNYTYVHNTSLEVSPFFFTMTGTMSLIYAVGTLTLYLFFSSIYESAPIVPVVDLIVTIILGVLWILSSISFSFGASLLKSTATYDNVKQVLCPPQFLNQPGANCVNANETGWKQLNIGLICGYTSFFLWSFGSWFVYKETHLHQPADQFNGGP